jgi:hypothetical protein
MDEPRNRLERLTNARARAQNLIRLVSVHVPATHRRNGREPLPERHCRRGPHLLLIAHTGINDDLGRRRNRELDAETWPGAAGRCREIAPVCHADQLVLKRTRPDRNQRRVPNDHQHLACRRLIEPCLHAGDLRVDPRHQHPRGRLMVELASDGDQGLLDSGDGVGINEHDLQPEAAQHLYRPLIARTWHRDDHVGAFGNDRLDVRSEKRPDAVDMLRLRRVVAVHRYPDQPVAEPESEDGLGDRWRE